MEKYKDLVECIWNGHTARFRAIWMDKYKFETILNVDCPYDNTTVSKRNAYHFAKEKWIDIKMENFIDTEAEKEYTWNTQKEAMRFNEWKPKFHLLHLPSLVPTVRVLEFWAKKYAPYNWMKTMTREDLLDSMMRHLSALIDWEETDTESWLSHIGHLTANCIFYSFHFIIWRTNKNSSSELTENENVL